MIMNSFGNNNIEDLLF